MGQKEYLIAITDFFKILANTLTAIMFGLAVYNIQTKSSILAGASIGVIAIGFVDIIIIVIYACFLDQLKNLKT